MGLRRREALAGLIGMAAGLVPRCGWSAASRRIGDGCRLRDADFGKIRVYSAAPWQLRPSDNFDGNILPRSVNASFDDALRERVLPRLERVFKTSPRFGYYVETDGAANALAHPDGAVVLGMHYLESLLRIAGGDFIILALCAHEYGHMKQFETKLDREIEKRLPAACVELHADYLAGYFLGRYAAPRMDLQAIGTHWSEFRNSTTHGTAQQRVEAIEAGFRIANSVDDIAKAVAFATRHVERYGKP